MWINISELFSLINEKHSTRQFNSTVEKLAPLLDCYFMIYKIMHDDDLTNYKNK